jgi:hypothetical protein
MKRFSPVIAALAFSSTFALADPVPGQWAPRVDVVKLLNLDATRANQVEEILGNAHLRMMEARKQIGPPTDDTTRKAMHSAMHAIRVDTDTQLAQVLTPAEMDTLRAARPRPPMRPE